MSNPSPLSDRLARAFRTPAGGVLGLVDELLAASNEQDIRITWQAGRCRILVPRADPPEQIEVPVQKSVVRALLARVAALCNERVPNSVSPYQGGGEVAVDPGNVILVKFVNTPEEQSLELSPAQLSPDRRSEVQSFDQTARRLADVAETAARGPGDPDALEEAHRRLTALSPAEPSTPWPTEDEITRSVRQLVDDYLEDPDRTEIPETAEFLDTLYLRMYRDAPIPRAEAVRFYETAGFELNRQLESADRETSALSGDATATGRPTGGAEVPAGTLQRLRADRGQAALGQVYALAEYAGRTPAQIAYLLGLSEAEIETILRQERIELPLAR